MENRSLIKLFTDAIIFFACVAAVVFLYTAYGERVLNYLYGEQPERIFIGDISLDVKYAISPSERVQGLSGRQSLGELEGLLFFFDEENYHGIWMKDMLFPIDIIWINNDLQVVDVEENVTPDTFPASFEPRVPARFVLEMNAFFSDTYNINVGDTLFIPASDLPADLKENLQ